MSHEMLIDTVWNSEQVREAYPRLPSVARP
jgi:DNA-binding winged helix-turn-helix (wHTH) protein